MVIIGISAYYALASRNFTKFTNKWSVLFEGCAATTPSLNVVSGRVVLDVLILSPLNFITVGPFRYVCISPSLKDREICTATSFST